MPSLISRFHTWLGSRFDVTKNGAASANSPGESMLLEHDSAQSLLSYDENLLERCRTAWQFGDWESLAKLERDNLQHHPDRAKLALLAAAGHLQQGDSQTARQFTRLAQDWGCSKKLLSQILISGVHNSLGRSAAIAGHQSHSLKHFNAAVAIGNPGSDQRLLAQARLYEQCTQLGLPATQLLPGGPKAEGIGMANPRAAYAPAPPKPLIRTIHHLSCTGGTLFSKCIAAQPNVVLLNEIDPFSKLSLDKAGKSQFSPRDIISLLHQSGHDFDDEAIADVFVKDISTIHMVYGHGVHVDGLGKPLHRYPTLPPATPISQFAEGCFICQPTVFARRTLWQLLGPLDEDLKAAFDFDYWLSAFAAFPGRIGFVDAVQAHSRLHAGCITVGRPPGFDSSRLKTSPHPN